MDATMTLIVGAVGIVGTVLECRHAVLRKIDSNYAKLKEEARDYTDLKVAEVHTRVDQLREKIA